MGDTRSLAGENELTNAKVAESKIKNVDKVKFTHKEWKGIQYADLDGKTVNGEDVFGIEREDARLSIIPYQDQKTAANAVWDYNSREKSTYFALLTGKDNKWDLTVVQNQE